MGLKLNYDRPDGWGGRDVGTRTKTLQDDDVRFAAHQVSVPSVFIYRSFQSLSFDSSTTNEGS